MTVLRRTHQTSIYVGSSCICCSVPTPYASFVICFFNISLHFLLLIFSQFISMHSHLSHLSCTLHVLIVSLISLIACSYLFEICFSSHSKPNWNLHARSNGETRAPLPNTKSQRQGDHRRWQWHTTIPYLHCESTFVCAASLPSEPI